MIEQAPQLKPQRLFATPEDTKALQDYIALYNGSEGLIANTLAFMSWNLCSKLTTPPEGYVDVRMDEATLSNIILCVKQSISVSCCEHKSLLVDIHKELCEVYKELKANEEDQS